MTYTHSTPFPTATPSSASGRTRGGSMLARLFVLFTLVPFIELFLLMQVGDVVGFWPTVASIVLTGFVGAWLAKREGLRVLREYQQALAELRMPDEGLTSGLLVLVGGALMIAPGVLTDIVGILLMIPPVRRVVARWVEAYVKKHFLGGAASAGGPAREVVFRTVQVGPRGVVDRTVRQTATTEGVRKVEVVHHAPVAEPPSTSEPEALEPDLIVDRRGRIVARLEE